MTSVSTGSAGKQQQGEGDNKDTNESSDSEIAVTISKDDEIVSGDTTPTVTTPEVSRSSTPPNNGKNTQVHGDHSSNKSNQQQHNRLKLLRRSSRHRNQRTDQDPIIAPGFGTIKDIRRLAAQLSEGSDIVLSPDVVELMMNSRGQGMSKRSTRHNQKTTEEDDVAAATAASSSAVGSSAWADFMKEEGGVTTTANTATTTSATAPSAPSSNNAASKSNDRKRTYDDNDDSKKKSKSATTSSSAAATVDAADDNDWMEQQCGVLVQAGTLDTTVVGRSKIKIENPPAYNFMVPTKLLSPKIIVKTVHTSCNSCHSIAITKQGIVYGWGRNECKQLSPSLPDDVVLPTVLDGLPTHSTVISAATGKSHTLFLYKDGSVYATGDNKAGQCGVKANMEYIASYRKCIFQEGGETVEPHIKQIACGEDYSMAVSTEGYLFSAGSSEFGQLGNGETGEHIVKAGKMSFANSTSFVRRSTFCHLPSENRYSSSTSDAKDKIVPLDDTSFIRIDKVACGKHHTLAIEMVDDDPSDERLPRVFSWGCGDYGCLGHGVQADEYFPRMIGSLVQTIKLSYAAAFGNKPKSSLSVSAGSQCSLLQLPNGHVYYWGKHRSIGEATMRPSLVDALANNAHIVRYVDAGAQTVVCSTANAVTVVWGQGPHGELGLGQTKSSAKPTFVPDLDGCRVASMACGYGHTLYVIRNDDDEDKAAVKKLNTVDEEACQPLIDAAESRPSKRDVAAESKSSSKKKKGKKD